MFYVVFPSGTTSGMLKGNNLIPLGGKPSCKSRIYDVKTAFSKTGLSLLVISLFPSVYVASSEQS